MAETISTSYCNHLRGKLIEWQRGFKSRTGRQPTREDFKALEHDSSARGRHVHAAYMALNRTKGEDFAKSLSASVSTQKTVIVGGPRQTAAERRHYSQALAAGNSGGGGDGGGKGGCKSVIGSGAAPGTKQNNPLSRHIALMERLKPKVQQRNISRSAAAAAGGGGRGGAGTVNAVLAAGDGHRRADTFKDRAGKKKCLLEGSSTAAGVTVSRRARSMGATATAAAVTTYGRAISARRDKSRSQNSHNHGRKGEVGVIGGRESGGGGKVEETGRDGRRLKATERTEPTAVVAAIARGEREERSGPSRCGSASAGSNEPSDVGGDRVVGSSDVDDRDMRDLGSRLLRGEDNAPTPEREVTRRKAAADLPFRTRVGALSLSRAGLVSGSRSSSSSAGFPSAAEEEKTTELPRRGSPGQLSQTSDGAAGNQSKDQSRSKVQDDGPSARQRVNTGRGGAPRSTAADEAGLAVAMMDIMSGSPMIAAESIPKAGRKHEEHGSRSSVLSLATKIVNTVGGVERSGVGGGSDHPALSASSGRAAGESSAVQLRARGASTAVTADVIALDSADAVCGPGMVAPSGRRESATGSDWKLRASRAVGRAREEGIGKDATVWANGGTGPVSALCGVGCQSVDEVAVDGENIRSEEAAGVPHGVSRSLSGSSLDDSSTSEAKEMTISGRVSSAGTHCPTSRQPLESDDSVYGSGRNAKAQAHPTRRVRDSDAESSDDEGAVCTKERPAAVAPRGTATMGGGTGDRVGGAKRSAGGSSKKKAARKTEVSDNFVRMDLKSKGSSRFKRKGSGRSRARGGSGGRRFGGGGGGGGGQWVKGGRGYSGSSKWGSKEDPVTGEKGGGLRDRPVSSGAAKCRAGLDVLDQCLDALDAAVGGHGDSSSPSFQRPKNAREEEELFLRLAPRCPQHQRAAKLLTVRKTGINKGRKFYVCSLPRGEGCDFFMWAEDNPALVLSELTLRETPEEWRGRKAARWEGTFLKLPIPELKKELKKRRLSCGGKKDELVKRLVGHSVTKLESSTTVCVVNAQGKSSEPPDSRLRARSGDAGLNRCKSSFSTEQSDHDGEGNGDSESESELDSYSDFEFAFEDDAAVEFSGPVKAAAGVKPEDDKSKEALLLSSRATSSQELEPQKDKDDDGEGYSKSNGCPMPLGCRGNAAAEEEEEEEEREEKKSSRFLAVKSAVALAAAATTMPKEDVARVAPMPTTKRRRLGDGRGQQPAAGEEERECDHEEAEEGERGQGGETGEDDEPAWASLVESDDEGDSDDDSEDGKGQTSSNNDLENDAKKVGEVAAVRCPRRKRRKLVSPGGVSLGDGGEMKRTGSGSAASIPPGNDGGGHSDEEEKEGGVDCPLTPTLALKKVFGHETFRDGQRWGIDRALGGKRSLLVLATGTGKSLVYQLPALLLPGITVVVSPLVSLMEDQMARLPPQLPGASLSGSHGGLREVAATVRDLKAGRVKVLFLSPEKLCSPSFRRLASTPGALPPVSLLCVDEAHCLSQWSHNFRPSYLRLGQALELLRPESVLALTATASRAVVADIRDTLGIPEEGIRIGSWDRANLRVAVSRTLSDADKRETLSKLLRESPLDTGSVVVYVWRQTTAEALSNLLAGEGHEAVAYHGGMEAGAREKAQAAFTRGRARIVVATVAFGLGVDMRDIRGVVHFDMPKSIENYVQEIGRAGRDGREALCALLLCDQDFVVHHSLAHSKGLEVVQVRALLRAIVGDASQGIGKTAAGEHGEKSEAEGGGRAEEDSGPGEESIGVQKALCVWDLEAKLDIGGQVVETVLSVLEGEPYRLVKFHAILDDSLHVHFRKRRPSVLAAGEPVIGLLLAMGTVEGLPSSGRGYSYGHGSAKMSLVQLAEALGWEPTAVVRELRRLQFMGEVEYSLSRRSFHVTLLRGISPAELDKACAELHRTLAMAESLEAEKVEAVYRALAAEASRGGDETTPSPHPQSRNAITSAGALHATISRYFDEGPRRSSIAAGNSQHGHGNSRGSSSSASSGGDGEDKSDTVAPTSVTSSTAAVTSLLSSSTPLPRLPHEPLDERACDALVRDASVLVSDPSFRGKVSFEDDERGWRAGGGGGAGGVGVGGGASGMAPHAWLLKDVPMLARAVARVFHAIGSVCFPAAKWRDSAFWGRYRKHSFGEVKSKLEIALGARR